MLAACAPPRRCRPAAPRRAPAPQTRRAPTAPYWMHPTACLAPCRAAGGTDRVGASKGRQHRQHSCRWQSAERLLHPARHGATQASLLALIQLGVGLGAAHAAASLALALPRVEAVVMQPEVAALGHLKWLQPLALHSRAGVEGQGEGEGMAAMRQLDLAHAAACGLQRYACHD